MKERPVIQALPIVETAVYDTNAFLAHRENRFFLNGERVNPITDSSSSEIAIGVFLLGMGAIIVGVRRLVLEGGDGSNIYWILGGVVVALIALWLSNLRIIVREGQVLEGVVIDAEKIRVYQYRHRTDNIGVRYEFTTPDGSVIRHRVETPTMEAGSTVAPVSGSRVYVWYEVDGKHYLL